jgi:hypothetical protein
VNAKTTMFVLKAIGDGSIEADAAAMTFVLNGMADGSIECDDETREVFVAKARHMLRDADTGQFRRMNDHENNIPDGSGPLPVRHSGAVLPQLRRRT